MTLDRSAPWPMNARKRKAKNNAWLFIDTVTCVAMGSGYRVGQQSKTWLASKRDGYIRGCRSDALFKWT